MSDSKWLKVDIDDTYIDYIKCGHGKKNLICIAGLSLTSLEGLEMSVANAYKLLLDEYTCYFFDRKVKICEGYSIEDMADDTYKALKSLGIDNADFVGVSQGGMIAQVMAIKYKEMVNKLVITSSLCKTNDIAKNKIGQWMSYAENFDVVSLNRSFLFDLYSDEFVNKYKDYFGAIENKGTKEDCKHFVILAKSIADFDISSEIKNITCPTFVIGSNVDKVLGGEPSKEIANILNCPIYMYDNYGHACYDEAPDYVERLLNYLKGE